MSEQNASPREAAPYLRTRARPSLARRLREHAESFFASTDLSYERMFLVVRPAIALLVIVAVAVQGSKLPGGTGVIVACLVAILYNFGVAVLVFRRRVNVLRVTTLLFDNATVIGASIFVFMRMGHVGYESDLWLIYMTLIVTNALYYGPIGSLFFTSLWSGLFLGMTLTFYDGDSYSADQLPMRMTFFALLGFVSISLSAELRKRREKLEVHSRQTLTMLATIVEARDTDAGLHLRHITHYSRALALHLGLSETAANEVSYAAMIHDVGKAQVPDAILKKPGPLTPAERREIEKHTLWGHELLAGNEEFRDACQVARSHHERWDGKGYPDGLAGDDIPLAARITAVADVYDALISERPYKHAWPPREAIAEIKRLRGTHMDPAIVDAFVELYDAGVLRDIDTFMRDEPDEEQARLAA